MFSFDDEKPCVGGNNFNTMWDPYIIKTNSPSMWTGSQPNLILISTVLKTLKVKFMKLLKLMHFKINGYDNLIEMKSLSIIISTVRPFIKQSPANPPIDMHSSGGLPRSLNFSLSLNHLILNNLNLFVSIWKRSNFHLWLWAIDTTTFTRGPTSKPSHSLHVP